MRYTKSSVRTHSDNGYNAQPAVNIKRSIWEAGERGDFPSELLRAAAAEAGYEPEPFVSWWRNLAEERMWQMLETYGSLACESGFEFAREIAADIFPSSVSVWQEGRSGGWLVVEGLPSLDSWDAVALSKWRKFEHIISDVVAHHAENVASLVAINAYEAHLSEVAAAERFETVGKWERAFAGTAIAGFAEAFTGTENN